MILYHTTKETIHRIFANDLPVECPWCHRYKINDKWVQLPNPPQQIVSHGICEDCSKKLEEEVDIILKKQNH